MEAELTKVLGTKRGQDMVKAIEARGSPLEVRINSSGKLTGDTKGGKYINVDPSSHPLIRTTAGKVPASTARIIGHELGHAVFGTGDVGPGRMSNVLANENPIAVELGEPARTHY